MQRELTRIIDNSGQSVLNATSRFSAIDGNQLDANSKQSEVLSSYFLSDQLFVDPEPSLKNEQYDEKKRIQMTQQEIAIAMSHISVWKLIATGDVRYALVLEDDVFFRIGFEKFVDRSWTELIRSADSLPLFDLLYLSYEESKVRAERKHDSGIVFRPVRGLWQLSGYVLSREGAQKLISRLPVRGPVDLWMNLQFESLSVFATSKSMINQRRDLLSGNSYSIVPVLAGLGVLSKTKPKKHHGQRLPGPVFAAGLQNSGLTSLAMALSMLGYRCCSDVSHLPPFEEKSLLEHGRPCVFNAYVNVQSLTQLWVKLAILLPKARFILTSDIDLIKGDDANDEHASSHNEFTSVVRTMSNIPQFTERMLVLSGPKENMWTVLCGFLGMEVPKSSYPILEDLGPRETSMVARILPISARNVINKKQDKLPWIVKRSSNWQGIATHSEQCDQKDYLTTSANEEFEDLNSYRWRVLEDTFPDNLALFRKENVLTEKTGITLLLNRSSSKLRSYQSGSICTNKEYRYGSFSAEIRPAQGSGLVTGMFLHRNSPRQEIDIEFVGKKTTQLMTNVYYNPGAVGAEFEYGYRGTPTVVNLGFDASESFHHYKITWTPSSMQWYVDGELIHKRVNWNPTPIPHLPMRFYLNLWPPRSKQLAGTLSVKSLPTVSRIRSVYIKAWNEDEFENPG